MKLKLRIIITLLILAISVGGTARLSEAKVKINKKTVKLVEGKTVTLKVTDIKKKVKWSTSNKKVAAVKSSGKYKGKVTAKKAGKATITAKVGSKKYKCKVVVTKKKKTTEQEKTTEQKTTTAQEKNTEKTTEEKSTEKQTSESTTEKQTTESTTEKQTTDPKTETTTETNSPSQNTLNADAGEYSISLTHTGEATYYEPTGEGAAKLEDFAKDYYTAAMNTYDYMNNMAGAYIEITDKDGDKVNVLITDRLPEGAKGDIDLKPDAFLSIEPLVTGRMKISWKIIPLPTNDPIQYVFKDGSTEYWAGVQVRNHRYPVAKFEYYDSSANKYVELPREEYNYFTAASGLGGPGPYTFRVTDIYGHQLVDTGIAMNSTGTPVDGRANFPY